MDIQNLTIKMHAFVRSKGWYEPGSPRPQTPRNLAISLSLDGSTPEAHDGLRGVPGTFEATLEAAARSLRRHGLRDVVFLGDQFRDALRATGVRDVVAPEMWLREPTDPRRLNGSGLLVVPVRLLVPGGLFPNDGRPAVYQATRAVMRLPGPGLRLPLPRPGTVAALLEGRRPVAGDRWVRAWRPVWEAPWAR